MQVIVLAIGKQSPAGLSESVEKYTNRIAKYSRLTWQIIPSPKKQITSAQQKQLETTAILKFIKPDDILILLDERGDQWSTHELTDQLESCRLHGTKRLVFVIGGAYGVAMDLHTRANSIWALSHLTLPHELVRLILAEQIYRAYTILYGEPYHHE